MLDIAVLHVQFDYLYYNRCWSVSLILLDYRDIHPGIDLGLDLLSWLILGIMGLIAIGLYFATGTAGLDLPDYSFIVLRVGAILAPIAA